MGASDQQYKRIDYGYDLVSGKVNSVSYQPGKPDAFLHFYRYDAENRLTDVYTTADSVTVEHEAHYEYYQHGPLARALIGQNQVQGLDYAYTLQGWLKAVNGSTLDSVNDMGHDGDPALQSRKYIAKDAYAFSLHYYDGDYYPINGTAFLTDLKSKLGSSYRGLYNGNISSMAVNIGILNNPKLYNYHYDQLNRLTGMDVLNGTNTGINLWTNSLTPSNDYTEKASYDPNGNILTYIRHGYGATPAMDSMTYHYQAGTNKLNHIGDNSAYTSNYPNDLDDQDEDNYKYDAAGNLIQDKAAGITTDMTWSVYGKLLTIPSKSISYQYDAAGNRIGKTVGSTSTWYVRDAQGNILATYSGENMALQEQDLYGSSRLGMISNAGTLSNTAQYLDHLGSGTLFTFTRGKKLFELTNHLGNVLATVSDKKFGTAVTGIPSQISYYTADVKSAQDYYPFGMEMPGRQFNSSGYSYGFNGQMKSDEIGPNGSHFYAKYWEFDTRTGRRWNLDPSPSVGISQYSTFNNSPISRTDLLGDTAVIGAGGTQRIEIDEKLNTLRFYNSSNYAISGTNTRVPVKAGQLRSFSNYLGTFTARWSTDASGKAIFVGYQNDKNQTLENVVQGLQEFASSWKYKLVRFGNDQLAEHNKNPLGYDLKLVATYLSVSALAEADPLPYSPGYNPSVTTKESMSGLGTITSNLEYAEGSFSIFNWQGYPTWGTKPEGPFRMLEGEEYLTARTIANKTNAAIHRAAPYLKSLQIHEITPVKFGGSPTDATNKLFLETREHMEYTNFWNNIMRNLKQ
jgi:hypothetical protein